MKTRILLISSFIYILLSNAVSAQVKDPLSNIRMQELKSDVVGSYPAKIWKYNWIVEYWDIYETKNIIYTSFGAPSEITVISDDNYTHTVYTYNSDEAVTQVLMQKRSGNEWVNDRRDIYEFDQNGNLTSFVNQVWYESEWIVEYKNQYSYTFDNLDRLTGMEIEEWDKESESWINFLRIEYSYHEDNFLIIEEVSETWKDGAWEKLSKKRQYYEGDKLSEVFISGWLDEAWVESSMMVYQYRDFESYTLTTYNGSGDENWTPSQRIVENYDSHGNKLLSTLEVFISEWMFFSGSEYSLIYEEDNLVERITKVYSMFDPSIPGAKSVGAWKNQYRELFMDFVSLSTGPIVLGFETVEHYPNPAMENVNLRVKNLEGKSVNIEVMDLNGKICIQDDFYVPANDFVHKMAIDRLPAGTFIIQARDGAGKLISSSRLVHQK